MIVGMVRKIQMPLQESIQRVASFQMWMPLKGKTELRQEADAEVSSVPKDLQMSPVVEARSAHFTILRRVKDRLVPFLCWFSQTSILQSGLKSLSDLSLTCPHSADGRGAPSDDHQWPERRPMYQVSLYSCTVEVFEALIHLYKAEIKDTPQSQQVQKLTSDDFQALCTNMVLDLLKTKVELFQVETPTTITNAWASHSVLPMVELSTERSKQLSEAAGDICKSLLEYLVTPDAAVSSALSEVSKLKKVDSDPSRDFNCWFNPGSGLVENAGLGASDEVPTSPSRADSALVLETSVEDSNHCSTSPTRDSCFTRPVPAAAKRRKLPAFRFGKKLNKVHPFEKIGEKHQSSYRNPQEASHGESEASVSTFKKLCNRMRRIFRAMTKL